MEDTTPPPTCQASPAGSLQKQSPREKDASAREVVDRQLPVFSATGRIPFASSGPADAGAGAVQAGGGESRLKDEMDMDVDGDGYGGVKKNGSGWEVPETPEK